jgi:hypothetical protein
VAGTNAKKAKKVLIDLLKASPPANTAVDYGYDGQNDSANRQYIWGGKATFQHDYAALTAGRKPREEVLVVELHLSVYLPGGTYEETDDTAATIGVSIEDLFANDPQLAGAIPGLRYAGIQGGEMDNSMDDGGVETHMTYQVLFKSRLS